MAIKVFIKRHVKKGKAEDTLALLKEVRSQALKQPGYISGETLMNHYDPCTLWLSQPGKRLKIGSGGRKVTPEPQKKTNLKACRRGRQILKYTI